MLKVENLSASYGKIRALKEISLEVNRGELVSIIGANGAGKSTLLKAIVGAVANREGKIFFDSSDISKADSIRIVKLGVSLVPEGRQVFGSLSIRENLVLGAYLRHKNESEESIEKDYEFVYSLFPILRERRYQLAETLSGGEQQMLAIARGIMAKPKLLLLDELSLGIAPILVRDIYLTIRKLNGQGLTLLLVEQNAFIALSIAQRAYVLETGRIVIKGEAKDLLVNEEVRKAYFGGRS